MSWVAGGADANLAVMRADSVAQDPPVHAWVEVFAAHLALDDVLDRGAVLCRHNGCLGEPVVHVCLRDAAADFSGEACLRADEADGFPQGFLG